MDRVNGWVSGMNDEWGERMGGVNERVDRKRK